MNKNCEECGLKDCVEVPWQIPIISQYPLLLVGQAPGSTETITRVPFTGSAGKMAWRVLKEAGLNKERLHITNTCCCCPPEDRQPTLREVQLCNARLKEEIHFCQPQFIIALGEIPMIALTGKTGIKSHRGAWHPLLAHYDYNCMVKCVLHPSFLLRQRQWIDITIADLRDVQQACEIGYIRSNIEVRDTPQWIMDPSPSELADLLEEMSSHVTAVDIETPSELDMRTAHVIGISFASNGSSAICLDLMDGPRDPKWEVMKRYLEDHRAQKVTQNGQFDIGVLETNGVNVKGLVWDTLYAEHTINSDLPGNLDALRSRYTKIAPYKPTKAEMKEFAKWEKVRRLVYNGWDAITTIEVMYAQIEQMDNNQAKVLREIEIPLIWVFNAMERKGVLLDQQWMALAYEQLGPVAEEIEQEWFAPIGVNPRSPVQLKKYFGVDCTGEDELIKLMKRGHSESQRMQKLLDYRELHKAASVYILGMYKRMVDGRIHTHFKIEGTGTGRPASENPNLNNVPKWLRAMFVSDEGKVWIEGDYTQQELHTIACVANDSQLLTDLANGVNVHHQMAVTALNREWETLTDMERLAVKAITFGTAYGRTARSIAMEFGITVRQAEEWQNACVNKYPGLLEYRETQLARFRQIGRCYTAFGRVRVLQSFTQGLNTPIQGSAADITNTSLIELHKRGIDLRLTVYDSIITQANRGEEEDVKREMQEVMERPIAELGGHKFPAKYGVGVNWKDME